MFSVLRGDSFSPGGRIVFLCLLVGLVTLLARLPFVVDPGLSIDSYYYVNGFPDKEQLYGQGRFGQYFVLMLGKSLGLDMPAFGSMLQGVGLFLFASSVPLIFLSFRADEEISGVAIVMASLVVTLHPFMAEILTFSEASFTAQCATGLGVVAAYVSARTPRLWWCGVLMLVAALSMYQLVINIISLMILVGFCQVIVGGRFVGDDWWMVSSRFYSVLAMLFLGLFCYFLVYKSINMHLGIGDTGRGQLLAVDDVGMRMDEIEVLAGKLVERPLIIKDAYLSSMFMWLASMAGWLLYAIRIVIRRPRGYVFGLLLLPLFPLAGLGLVAIGHTWWPVPRVLGGVVVVWAIGIYWLFNFPLQRNIRWGAGLVVCLMLVGAVGIGHRIHGDQILLNSYDRNLAAAVYRELNENEMFSDSTRIAIVNRNMRWAHALPLSTVYMDMNLTAFALTGAQQGAMRLATGREVITIEPTKEQVKVCDRIPSWPKSGFTEMQENGQVVVCI